MDNSKDLTLRDPNNRPNLLPNQALFLTMLDGEVCLKPEGVLDKLQLQLENSIDSIKPL